MGGRSQSVDTSVPEGSSGSVVGLNKNAFTLRPVAHGESGEGLPYAPENFPNPGDMWTWKAGTRTMTWGLIKDRYLYPPSRLRNPSSGNHRFASKCRLKEYIEKEFPDADVDAFFSSFSWKMPSSAEPAAKGCTTESHTNLGEEVREYSGDELKVGAKQCQAGNEMCTKLCTKSFSHPVIDCNICCSEPGFCRDCCCILCCKTIDWAHGGYSFIRCEATVEGSCICGHIAHVDCALRSYVAGSVGGRLDVEYYCMRCDKRTDLDLHVKRILQVCESLDSPDETEKILNLGLSILRGSQKESAKSLLHRIELSLKKLGSRVCLEQIPNVEESSSKFAGKLSHTGDEGTLSGNSATNDQEPMDFTAHSELTDSQQGTQQLVYITSDRLEPLKLEEEINRVLRDLKNSQETESRIALKCLNTQKESLLDLYKQLETERSKRVSQTSSSTDCTSYLTNVLDKVSQIKKEKVKFRDMKEVAKGFGRVPKPILKQHFGLEVEE